MGRQVRFSPVDSVRAISYLAEGDKRKVPQCDTAHDIENFLLGLNFVPKECLECDGYNISCKEYSYERNEQ